jgi:hypothetical protein
MATGKSTNRETDWMMMSNTTGNEFARALGFKPSKTDEMFDRAEALQNTAKAIKGIKALDDDALETLYRETKAERRERNKATLEDDWQAVCDSGEPVKMLAGDMKEATTNVLQGLVNTLDNVGNFTVSTVAGNMTSRNVARVKDLAKELYADRPNLEITHMHIREDDAIEIEYLEDGDVNVMVLKD